MVPKKWAREDNHTYFRSYFVMRNYKLFGEEKTTPTSEVFAELTFVPPELKSHAIRQTNGTVTGERIGRRMLEGCVPAVGYLSPKTVRFKKQFHIEDSSF